VCCRWGVSQEKDPDFDGFVMAAAARLHRVAVALTGERGAAEDLVQDVLEQVYLRWHRIDDPYAYARRALINGSVNRWRVRARRREVALTEAHDDEADDAIARVDDRNLIIHVLAALPVRQRAVVVLRFLEDLSEAETASLLGCSVGTVKSQTARALTRLRNDLLRPSPVSHCTQGRAKGQTMIDGEGSKS
jgi:RNA polymerase sigma-70 factor (sigma-E family)